MSPTNELANEFVIDNLETLKAVAHNLRLDILQNLKVPKTVKEIAKHTNLPATKLYYHVNLMEKHGLIRVVETNVVSGILEKKYRVVARNYRLQEGLLAKSNAIDEDVDRMLGAIFDITRTEIKRSIQADKMKLTEEDRRGILWRSTLCLTPDQFEEFYKRLDEILQELDGMCGENDTAVNAKRFGLTVAFYPSHTLADEEKPE